MTILAIDVPVTDWLSANHRRHWADTAGRTKRIRERAGWEARRQKLGVLQPPVKIVATIGYPARFRADPPNAAPTVKAIIDGLVDACTLPDDHSEIVTSTSFERGPTSPTPRHYHVTLTITNEGENND